MKKAMINLMILLLTCFDSSLQNEAGIKVRISIAGLNFGANLGVELLANEIKSLTIPNFAEDKSLMSYGVANIKLTYFKKPSASVVSIVGTGLSASLNDAAVEMSLDWRYKLGKGWFSISDSGSGTVKSNSISISVNVNIGRDDNGKPTIIAASCSCSISGFNIHINGGLISAIYNLIINMFENKIKNSIQDKICDSVRKVINEDGQNQLATLNTQVKIDSQIYLSYLLTDNPVFTSTYIETSHAGEFYSNTGIRYDQITPPLNIVLDNGKMVNLVMTERLFNSAGYVLQRLGRLNQIFPISDDIAELLNQPAGTKLQIQIEATDAPFIKIVPSSFTINITANVKVNKQNGENVLNLKASLLLNCDIHFEANIIKGKILNIKPEIMLINGNISSLAPAQFTVILKGLLDLALPSLNERGNVGFPIISLDHLSFVNSAILLTNGYTMLGTDLQVPMPQTVKPSTIRPIRNPDRGVRCLLPKCQIP